MISATTAVATPADPPAPPVDVDRVRADVGAAITKAFAALKAKDYATAKREIEGVVEAALDDQQATDRLQPWRQLVVYAERYPGFRDQALASAAKTGATHQIGSRHVGLVELTADKVVYRERGRNVPVARDALPADIEQGLVRAWFAADGRAANHLFLGAAALAQRKPDVSAARREWQAAADGGERDGLLLQAILDDPVIHGP